MKVFLSEKIFLLVAGMWSLGCPGTTECLGTQVEESPIIVIPPDFQRKFDSASDTTWFLVGIDFRRVSPSLVGDTLVWDEKSGQWKTAPKPDTLSPAFWKSALGHLLSAHDLRHPVPNQDERIQLEDFDHVGRQFYYPFYTSKVTLRKVMDECYVHILSKVPGTAGLRTATSPVRGTRKMGHPSHNASGQRLDFEGRSKGLAQSVRFHRPGKQ